MSKKSRKSTANRCGALATGYSQRTFCSQPYQDEQFVTLRYYAQADLTATAGLASWGFRLNSPYDPDYTYTGVQPLGFDQWGAIYSKYVVYRTDVTVRATSRTVSGVLDVGMLATVDTNIPLLEACYGGRRGVARSTTGGAPPAVLKQSYSIAQLMGVSEAAIDIDDAFGAQTIGSNPPRPAYLWVVMNTSGASDAFSVAVELKMKVKFWLPNLVTTSLTKRVRPRVVEEPSTGLVTITAGAESVIGSLEKQVEELKREIARTAHGCGPGCIRASCSCAVEKPR